MYGYRENSRAWNEGLLLSIEIDKAVTVTPILLTAQKDGIIVADKEISQKRLSQINEQSKKLDDKEFLQKEWVKFCEKVGALTRPLLYGKSRVFIKLNRITKNKLFRATMRKNREMTTMNLIRCDAWREVITTLLETDVYGK